MTAPLSDDEVIKVSRKHAFAVWREHRDYGPRYVGVRVWATGAEVMIGRKMWRARAPWFRW